MIDSRDSAETRGRRPHQKFRLSIYGLILGVFVWFILRDLGFLDLIPFLRGRPEAVALFAAIGSYIAVTAGRSFLQAGAVLLLVLWGLVAFTPIATQLAQPMRVADEPEAADVVVVLAGGFQIDNEFSTSSFERTIHGLELIRGKFAPRLILSEATPAKKGDHLRTGKELMDHLGISCPVIGVGPAHDTHDEAVLVSQLAQKNGWKKILLVTSPVHSLRSKLTFQKTGLQVISSPCRETSYDFENKNSAGGQLLLFAATVRELVGLRVYKARGWL
jgi:uncharacterized SAM-binding protein YcdF (DUF218 family)